LARRFKKLYLLVLFLFSDKNVLMWDVAVAVVVVVVLFDRWSFVDHLDPK